MEIDKANRMLGSLILGWQMTPGDDPSYWLNQGSKAGSQKTEDLVSVPSESLLTNSVLIAQSGSGKSFFLGRLVEELLLSTKSRCVVLDPNGDFRKVHEIEDSRLWDNTHYDVNSRTGKLPHESSRDIFQNQWNQIDKQVFTHNTIPNEKSPYEKIQLWWPSISIDSLSGILEPIGKGELYHYHSFVRAIGYLAGIMLEVTGETFDILEISERISLSILRQEYSKRAFDIEDILNDEDNIFHIYFNPLFSTLEQKTKYGQNTLEMIQNLQTRLEIKRATTALQYMVLETAEMYFAIAARYKAKGIIASRPPRANLEPGHLEIIDLPSLPDKETRFLVTTSILESEWNEARARWEDSMKLLATQNDKRIPTFIVVDEAHNLMPREAQDQLGIVVRDWFRTIVAEGRKYGLFLILASQRPDKLDPLILSEFENVALMKISSRKVLNFVKEFLGVENVSGKVLSKCLEFDKGRVLLVGQWAPQEGQLLYCAARRTREGGRDLDPQYWATPRVIRSHDQNE